MDTENNMQIVWNQEVAEQLKNSHTVLELETFPVNGIMLTAWCVVPSEKLIDEMFHLEALKDLHAGFIRALKDKNYQVCQDASEHLMGKFGGELDSFYEEILKRINNEQN